MGRPAQNLAIRARKAPSQRRSSETVAAIIEAAARVLETEGLAGYNTNAVARRAGVSVGSLYQYFPGKEALTVALVERETKRFYDDAAPALEEPDGDAALDYLIEAAVRQQLLRPTLARLLDIEENRLALRCDAVTPDTILTLLVTIVERMEVGAKRPQQVAGDVYAVIRGMVDAAGERGETGIENLQRRVRAAVFGYLARTGAG